jgi:dTDP-4-dehydrorhamnose reductase
MASPGKVLVTGCRGQLGRDLVDLLSPRYDVVGIDVEDVDIRDREATAARIAAVSPSVVIHAAAFTDVDACESKIDFAMAVNGEGTRHVAMAAREIGARMIYYSTDYVFDGCKTQAYIETDQPNPQTVYGRSKLAGEKALAELVEDHIIMRIAWVYGRHGKNFIRTMLRLGNEQIVRNRQGEQFAALKVVDDQTGNPTWTVDIVRQTERIMNEDVRGIVHATSEGQVSWYRLACDVFEIQRLPVRVEPCTTDEFPRPAPRPRMSALENARLKSRGLNVMRDYREALMEFLKTNGQVW